MATLVARCCRKTNQLQSVRGMKNKEPIKIFVSQKKKRKKCCMLPGVAEKLISCSLCRGMESKEPIKMFTSPRNKQKKCCRGNTCCQVCQKTNPLQSVQGYGKQRTHKILISPRNRKKCCHGNTCCQVLLPGVAEKLISSNLCGE